MISGLFLGLFPQNSIDVLMIFRESIFTARKRSLGEGNIFTSMCQEFCSRGGGGCLLPGGACFLRGVCSQGGLLETPRAATAAGGTYPTGMHSCLAMIANSDGQSSTQTFFHCYFCLLTPPTMHNTRHLIR